MSNKLPTISVTADKHSAQSDLSSSSSSHDTDSNDMDYGRDGAGGVTDVEDFDSQAEVLKPNSRRGSGSVKLKAETKSNTGENDVTDVEDYDTESEDEEKSTAYPELKLSLREFLQQGLHNQEAIDNDAKESCEIKAGDFVQAQNLNGLADYLTDCEDYDTDSEVEHGYEKSVCVDLDHAVGDQGRVNIADGEKNQDDSDQYEDVSVISDISDLASAMSECTGVGIRGMSEDEVLEVSDSGHEEVCQIACSGSESEPEGAAGWSHSVSESSFPAIDVAFVSASGQPRRNSKSSMPMPGQKQFLQTAGRHEEVLTDVEGIDDSAAEDSFDNEEEDEQPIPRAIILASGDDGTCVTDVEDMFCEDSSLTNSVPEVKTVSHEALPLPHREVVELKEDKYGDTITNVMPMDKNYEFGIYNHLKDTIATDSEDYSCADEWSLQHSLADEAAVGGSLIENEVIVSNELLKQQQNKRLEVQSNAESVTDVEEIFVAGTNRRKKLKARTPSKGKNKLLDITKGKEDGVTDVEDMDLSECGLPPGVKRVEQLKQQAKEKVSDAEDASTDDVSDMSEASDALPPPTCDKSSTKIKLPPLHLRLLKEDIVNQQHTDVEDVQCPSEAEDALEPPAVPVANSNSKELNDMLNESYTVVHERSGRIFNTEAEKLHIKGMIRDAHTDVEYVESDESAARGGN
ncbi:uncharacterized protein Dana_GF26694 [Drosophila ananassae]|uniref:Uncharacterized protein n=1 Tax=Drosophila ananassae TaxID=7217 RepID=A0A0P9C4T2_DROAN|nr:uncharacterized protein LOC26514103 [Drosophila ananassae]KPU78736.1 uncharacterized protein Dana_GF26694 [Drosophila ananassae]